MLPKCRKNKFWIENIANLFCEFTLLPLDGMSLAEQMNALSRLVIIIFLLLLLFEVRFSILFLLLSLLFIIILYYIQRNNMERFKAEHYTPTRVSSLSLDKGAKITYGCSNSKKFCNDEILLDGYKGDPEWMSENQKLVGKANPKTKIQPVIVPPITDLDYWRGSNLVTYPQINQQTNIDLYRSGYYVSSNCENSSNPKQKDRYFIDEYRYKKPIFPYLLRPEESGDVNTACGYNPEQLLISGLPTNLSDSNYSREHSMKQYNENLYTQTIQPGVYTRNQINEPINSNIGISFTQQFPPKTQKTNFLTGDIIYTEHDPRIIEPVFNEIHEIPRATESNIYDPRFTGYGTSYRSYTDDNIGQTRFYYNDVDAIRRPNYITRSHIDNQPFADHYGPIPENSANGNPNTANIHALANDAFLQGSLQHRTELSERLMRKVNSEQWQRRSAPVRGNLRMLGGSGNI